MNDDKSDFYIEISKKPFCLSFKKLDNYFRSPDLKIQNLYAISAQQFIADLDSVINFSKNKRGSYGRIDKIAIAIDSNTLGEKDRHPLTGSVQKRNKLNLQKILNKLFKSIAPAPIKKIEISSWSFKDFDAAKKFQVGKCYTLRPVSITYNSTQQDYKYNKQIISEFYIEEANGNIKKLVIIDNIKKETVRREKYIDGQKIHCQHYKLEIHHHRLNRGLMKTFLFHQIYKPSEYDQDTCLLHNRINSKSIAEQSTLNVSRQTKGTTFSTQKKPGRIPEEYINIPGFKIPAQNKEKPTKIDNVHDLQNKHDDKAIAEDPVKVHRIFEMKTGSIYTADGYNDSKPFSSLIQVS